MMKNQRSSLKKAKALWLILLLAGGVPAFSQVSVNADGSAPDPSAMLEVKSVERGMLLPRMTIAQRNAIASPARGLLVFCTDDNYFYFNQGTPAVPQWARMNPQWVWSGTGIAYNQGNVGIGVSNPSQKLTVNGNITAQYGTASNASYRFGDGAENTGFSSPYANSAAMINNGTQSLIVDEVGRVAVSSASPNVSAQLEVNSTNAGFLLPRMNTATRNNIASPAEGLMILNTDETAINVFNGTSWAPFTQTPCGQPFVDPRDGTTYGSVQIGNQCWMTSNLNLGTRRTGTTALLNNGIYEKYCYNDLASNCDDYGGLYTWNEMMNYNANAASTPNYSQGICPTGWHVATDPDWCALEFFLQPLLFCEGFPFRFSDGGGKLKEAGLAHWATPNTGATNSTGFTALPAGYRTPSGLFSTQTTQAYFWTSTENGSDAWNRSIAHNSVDISRVGTFSKQTSFSVRCVKD